MDKTKIGYLVLIAMIIVFAGILYWENKNSPKSTERPSADDLYRDPANIGQDMTPDDRIDDEIEQSGSILDLSYTMSRNEIENPGGFEVYGIYTGTLPCADCAGIETELRLMNSLSSSHRRYILKQVYKSTREGDQVFWESGVWESSNNELDQLVYRMLKDEGQLRSVFIKTNSRVIQMADQDENLIESELNYSLYRLPK